MSQPEHAAHCAAHDMQLCAMPMWPKLPCLVLRLQVPNPTLDKDLAALLESQHDADVKFKVENAEFAAHKLVLTFRSPFFRCVRHIDTAQNEGTVCSTQSHLYNDEYSLT